MAKLPTSGTGLGLGSAVKDYMLEAGKNIIQESLPGPLREGMRSARTEDGTFGQGVKDYYKEALLKELPAALRPKSKREADKEIKDQAKADRAATRVGSRDTARLLSSVDKRFNLMNRRIDNVTISVRTNYTKIASIENRLSTLENKFNLLSSEMASAMRKQSMMGYQDDSSILDDLLGLLDNGYSRKRGGKGKGDKGKGKADKGKGKKPQYRDPKTGRYTKPPSGWSLRGAFSKILGVGEKAIMPVIAAYEIWEAWEKISELDPNMPLDKYRQGVADAIKPVARFGLVWVGAILGGAAVGAVTGPGFIVGVIGGAAGGFIADYTLGDDIDSIVDAIVTQLYIGETKGSVTPPKNISRAEAARRKQYQSKPIPPQPQQQYRKAKVVMGASVDLGTIVEVIGQYPDGNFEVRYPDGRTSFSGKRTLEFIDNRTDIKIPKINYQSQSSTYTTGGSYQKASYTQNRAYKLDVSSEIIAKEKKEESTKQGPMAEKIEAEYGIYNIKSNGLLTIETRDEAVINGKSRLSLKSDKEIRIDAPTINFVKQGIVLGIVPKGQNTSGNQAATSRSGGPASVFSGAGGAMTGPGGPFNLPGMPGSSYTGGGDSTGSGDYSTSGGETYSTPSISEATKTAAGRLQQKGSLSVPKGSENPFAGYSSSQLRKLGVVSHTNKDGSTVYSYAPGGIGSHADRIMGSGASQYTSSDGTSFRDTDFVIGSMKRGQNSDQKAAVSRVQVQDQLRKEALAKGLNIPEATLKTMAAAIAGQAYRESNYDPKALHDKDKFGNYTGAGMYGHRNERRDAAFKWIRENKLDPNTMEAWNRYFAHEIMNATNKTDPQLVTLRNQLLSGKLSLEEAVQQTTTLAERPRKAEQLPSSDSMKVRQQGARMALQEPKRISGGQTSGGLTAMPPNLAEQLQGITPENMQSTQGTMPDASKTRTRTSGSLIEGYNPNQDLNLPSYGNASSQYAEENFLPAMDFVAKLGLGKAIGENPFVRQGKFNPRGSEKITGHSPKGHHRGRHGSLAADISSGNVRPDWLKQVGSVDDSREIISAFGDLMFHPEIVKRLKPTELINQGRRTAASSGYRLSPKGHGHYNHVHFAPGKGITAEQYAEIEQILFSNPEYFGKVGKRFADVMIKNGMWTKTASGYMLNPEKYPNAQIATPAQMTPDQMFTQRMLDKEGGLSNVGQTEQSSQWRMPYQTLSEAQKELRKLKPTSSLLPEMKAYSEYGKSRTDKPKYEFEPERTIVKTIGGYGGSPVYLNGRIFPPHRKRESAKGGSANFGNLSATNYGRIFPEMNPLYSSANFGNEAAEGYSPVAKGKVGGGGRFYSPILDEIGATGKAPFVVDPNRPTLTDEYNNIPWYLRTGRRNLENTQNFDFKMEKFVPERDNDSIQDLKRRNFLQKVKEFQDIEAKDNPELKKLIEENPDLWQEFLMEEMPLPPKAADRWVPLPMQRNFAWREGYNPKNTYQRQKFDDSNPFPSIPYRKSKQDLQMENYPYFNPYIGTTPQSAISYTGDANVTSQGPFLPSLNYRSRDGVTTISGSSTRNIFNKGYSFNYERYRSDLDDGTEAYRSYKTSSYNPLQGSMPSVDLTYSSPAAGIGPGQMPMPEPVTPKVPAPTETPKPDGQVAYEQRVKEAEENVKRAEEREKNVDQKQEAAVTNEDSSPGSVDHNPESRRPTPGNDGYGSQKESPDEGGICSI